VSLLADGVQSDNSQNLLGRLALSPHVTPLVGANEEYRDLGRDGIVVYFRTRKLRAEGGSGEDILAEAFALYSPFFLLTMIALNAFVGFGMLLIGPTHWFPGDLSSWINYHSAPIVGTATMLSVFAPLPLYWWRLRRNQDALHKPRLSQACWTVF